MTRCLVLGLLLVACHSEAPQSVVEGGIDAALLSFIFADAEPSVALPATSARASDLGRYATAVPRSARSIGHTSVVFRIDFADAGALRAAYKPESKRGHKRYRGEVAAYRLAKALGISSVPPATIRTFKRDVLRASMVSDAHAVAIFDDEVIDRSQRVYGALIPWIDKLEFTPLESPAEQTRWKKELTRSGDLAEDRRSLAAQISTLIVFDVLTGNWDRWSGGNVGLDKQSGTLLFIDNDAAFFDPIPPAFAAQMALLRSVDRFSRSLVARLRLFDALNVADAVAEEEPGTPLLSPRAIADADHRRKDVLAVIDEKIAVLGEAAVLFFP